MQYKRHNKSEQTPGAWLDGWSVFKVWIIGSEAKLSNQGINIVCEAPYLA